MQAAKVYEQILSATNNSAPVAVQKLRAVECAQKSVRSMTRCSGALYFFCSDSKISSSLYLLSSLLQFSSVALVGSWSGCAGQAVWRAQPCTRARSQLLPRLHASKAFAFCRLITLSSSSRNHAGSLRQLGNPLSLPLL